MEYVFSAVASLAVAILAFLLQQKIKDNKQLKEEKEKLENQESNAVKNGILALLRVQLIEYHGKYTERMEISTHGYENWCLMYSAYVALGGNGMIVHMNEEIEDLHIKNSK